MNYKNYIIDKLKNYDYNQIIITSHAKEQAIFRNIEIAEIIKNILNPFRLSYAVKQEATSLKEEKFDCYFGYSNTQCHRYILVIKNSCIVCTVIKINRR
jgi:hypothetical protein